jgi:hypothetical protein
MPNLDEFLNKEKLAKPELERFGGSRPCSKCDKDSEEYFWDPIQLVMTWECPSGHKNEYRLK